MQFEINLVAVIVAALAGLVPGAIINSPVILGKTYLKEVKINDVELRKPAAAMAYALAAGILNALLMNIIFSSSLIFSPKNILEGFGYGVLLSIFAITASLLSVIFENRSWKWFGIVALIQALSFAFIGAVLALFMY